MITIKGSSKWQRQQAAKRRRRRGWYQQQGQWRRRRRNRRTGGYLGMELKFYDKSYIGGAIAAPADASGGEVDPSATTCFTTIAQGDGESNRDGKSCIIKSIMVKGSVYVAREADETQADAQRVVFLAIVLDKQTNGAQLNSEDVFTNASGNAGLAAQPFRNLQYSTRFKVLWSKTIQLPQCEMVYDGTNVEQAGYAIPFEAYIDCNIKVMYSGTTETIANTTDNSVHMIAYESSSGAAPALLYNSRTRFVG